MVNDVAGTLRTRTTTLRATVDFDKPGKQTGLTRLIHDGGVWGLTAVA